MIRFLFLSFFLGMTVILQTARFLVISGIGPNLVLIVFLLIWFSQFKNRLSFLNQSALIFVFLIIWFFCSPFWLFPALVLGFLVLLVALLKRFFTGNKLIDFILSLAALTVVFHLLLAGFKFSPFSWLLVMAELIYNILLGVVLWLFIDKILIAYGKAGS